MWANFVDSYFRIRDAVFMFVTSIVDVFDDTLADIVERADSTILDIVAISLPDSFMQYNLLQIMTGAFVPILLVIWLIKLFV